MSPELRVGSLVTVGVWDFWVKDIYDDLAVLANNDYTYYTSAYPPKDKPFILREIKYLENKLKSKVVFFEKLSPTMLIILLRRENEEGL